MLMFNSLFIIIGTETGFNASGALTRFSLIINRFSLERSLAISFERSVWRDIAFLKFNRLFMRNFFKEVSLLRLPYFPVSIAGTTLCSEVYYYIWSKILLFLFSPRKVFIEMWHVGGLFNFGNNVEVNLDIHGDYSVEVEGIDENMGQSFKQSVIRLNRNALARSKRSFVVSDKLKSKVQLLYDFEHEILVIPCTPSKEFIRSVPTSVDTREFDFSFCYVGGMQSYQCLDVTINFLVQLSKLAQVSFTFVSSSSLFADTSIDFIEFNAAILERRIVFKEYVNVPHLEVPKIISDCNFGFLLRRNALLNIEASPTKLREYLACGCIVIGSEYSGDLALFKDYSYIANLDTPIETANDFFVKYSPLIGNIRDLRSMREDVYGTFDIE